MANPLQQSGNLSLQLLRDISDPLENITPASAIVTLQGSEQKGEDEEVKVATLKKTGSDNQDQSSQGQGYIRYPAYDFF